MQTDPLVTVALPVFNGADTMEKVAQSVLAQDHQNIELLICDNGSTDGTEEIGRELARADTRVTYHRQPRNIGLINNFVWAKEHARGEFVRWIGDDDEIAPSYVSRCLDVFADDPRLILVTTQLGYIDADGATTSMDYDASAFRSDDPVARFAEMLSLLTRSYLLLDPLYGLARRDAVASITHDQVLRGDEIYAAKLALAGPWGHVPDLLGHRHWSMVPPARLVTLLDVPRWQARTTYLIQLRELQTVLSRADLRPSQRRRARAIAARFYLHRHRVTAMRRARKLRTRLIAR